MTTIFLSDDDLFHCENDSPEDLKLYINQIRADAAAVESQLQREREVSARLREAGRWIPCSERMPEIDEKYTSISVEVLACDALGKREVGRYMPNLEIWTTHTITPVAWMPLPEPPEVRDGN